MEGVDDDEAGFGAVDPGFEGFEAILGVDGQVFEASVEGGGGIGKRAEVHDEIALLGAFFHAEPEDGGLVGGEPGERGSGGDGEGEGGGEAGFALFGVGGEDDEVAPGDEVGDDPVHLGPVGFGEDGLEEAGGALFLFLLEGGVGDGVGGGLFDGFSAWHIWVGRGKGVCQPEWRQC